MNRTERKIKDKKKKRLHYKVLMLWIMLFYECCHKLLASRLTNLFCKIKFICPSINKILCKHQRGVSPKSENPCRQTRLPFGLLRHDTLKAERISSLLKRKRGKEQKSKRAKEKKDIINHGDSVCICPNGQNDHVGIELRFHSYLILLSRQGKVVCTFPLPTMRPSSTIS